MELNCPYVGLAAALLWSAATSPMAYGADPHASLSTKGDTVAFEEAAFKHRGMTDFNVVLPDAKGVWKTLGESLYIQGVEFAIDVQGDLKFVIDINGDGDLDEAVKGNAGYVELTGKDESGATFHYAVRFRNDGAKKWSWSPSHVQQGRIQGTTVSFVDRNGNGRYDDLGQDAYYVGDERGAALLSSVIHLDGKLFELEVDKTGSVAKTKPYEGETGTLQAASLTELKGDLVAAVFTSGDMSFNLAGHAKGMRVPVGKYTLASGFIERGSESASIARGRMEPIEVTKDAAIAVALGGPLTGELDEPTVAGGQVTVRPSFHIFGKAGESYVDFLPVGRSPKVYILDAETGKELKKGAFPAG